MYTKKPARIITEKVKKKMLDKEIPWEQIKPSDMSLYKEAEDKEWSEWQQRGSVRIMTLAESRKVSQTVEPSRIIGLRYVYRVLTGCPPAGCLHCVSWVSIGCLCLLGVFCASVWC